MSRYSPETLVQIRVDNYAGDQRTSPSFARSLTHSARGFELELVGGWYIFETVTLMHHWGAYMSS